MNEFINHIRQKFIAKFYENTSQDVTLREAYEITEMEFERDYGSRLYKDYESFKVVKCKVLRLKKKQIK